MIPIFSVPEIAAQKDGQYSISGQQGEKIGRFPNTGKVFPGYKFLRAWISELDSLAGDGALNQGLHPACLPHPGGGAAGVEISLEQEVSQQQEGQGC